MRATALCSCVCVCAIRAEKEEGFGLFRRKRVGDPGEPTGRAASRSCSCCFQGRPQTDVEAREGRRCHLRLATSETTRSTVLLASMSCVIPMKSDCQQQAEKEKGGKERRERKGEEGRGRDENGQEAGTHPPTPPPHTHTMNLSFVFALCPCGCEQSCTAMTTAPSQPRSKSCTWSAGSPTLPRSVSHPLFERGQGK